MNKSNYILEMKGISKSFPGVQALKQVDMSVKAGEVHCLIGANGAGKSTLMKILAGVYLKDEGETTFQGRPVEITDPISSARLGIAVIYQELSLTQNMSVAENIFLGKYPKKYGIFLNWTELNQRAQAIINDLGIKIDVKKPVSGLSIGQRQIVELAKALATEAKLIVMDEPSATLSGEEFETLVRVIEGLKAKGITVIYISHRLEELFRVGDRVTVLRDGRHITTTDLRELNQDQLVELIIGHTLSKGKNESSVMVTGEEIISLTDVSTSKLTAINLALNKGEILGLYGLVGSGRTEVLRVIYGVDKPLQGHVKIRGKKASFKCPADAIKSGIAMVPENRKTQGLVLNLSVWENSIISSLRMFTQTGVLKYSKMYNKVSEYVGKLKIVTPSIKTPVRNLSGGNQQKVVIAKWLIRKSTILLFDEPTQGIDIGAKEEVYSIIKDLASKEFGVVVASSELEELLQLCDRILVMYNGKVAGEFRKDNFQEETILRYAVAGG
ncbi:sugar ABC transporter ATP-binding protein [Desulforamulus aeronauticus]|uniref:Ribose transport system ATP-binding protein n=1 Tax=Desulforamulus aeronauticus DSM 10349 TaxID=1121421 RepID=A0A1M6TKZ2_9FIRM|nr:sugar ABC transporter ATP-binding protein [Desulforamulus aeronauticus]SHK57665.1 ribose transport system ATP-binding protein [Desulforamulus aeronauticus DSM 10349]